MVILSVLVNTPFRVNKIDLENFELCQNEEMKGGSYNRVAYAKKEIFVCLKSG
jgi:hypothetical protein